MGSCLALQGHQHLDLPDRRQGTASRHCSPAFPAALCSLLEDKACMCIARKCCNGSGAVRCTVVEVQLSLREGPPAVWVLVEGKMLA